MFDDQPNQGSATPPQNLPVGEPEDIFESVDTTQPAAVPPPADQSQPVETSAMETPSAPPVSAPSSALDAGVLRAKAAGVSGPETPSETGPEMPSSEASAVRSALPPAGERMAPTPQPVQKQEAAYQIKSPSIGRGIITVVIIIVVLAIVGGGGWWIYTNFIQAPAIPEGPATTFPDNEFDAGLPPEETTASPEPIGGTTTENGDVGSQMIDEEVLFGEPIDRDADGIDDVTENRIGTDPNNWDTDGDELSDGDEVLVWETDPLNPDTDGDGFTDGAEVRNGYSPTGPGRIFEAPTTTPSSQATSTQ